MKKNYFGYIRVSTKRQGDGASLSEQRADIEAYVGRHGLTIIRWFCEERTAAKAGRAQFDEMVRELRHKKAAGVIIHKVDRGSRNGHDWATIGDLVDAKIDVRFAHDNIDLTTRGGRLTADVLAAIAADFIRNNREVVRQCMHGWLKLGYYPWPAPPGYENRGEHQLKTVDPVRGPLVVKAFELYASGAYSLDTLRAELARRGLTTKAGQPLSRSTAATILRNPFYVGTIRMRASGAVYEGKHRPLVSTKIFDQVQALLDGRVFPKEARAEFRFRRLIRCGQCPRTLTAERQKGHVYYRCHTSTCRGTSVAEQMVDERTVMPALEALQFDDDELQDIKAIVGELVHGERQETAGRVETVNRDLAKVAERLQRTTDAMIDGLLDDETFNERKAALLAERARLTEARNDSEPAAYWRTLAERFERGSVALRQYISASDGKKRALLLSLGSNFLVRGNELVFQMDFPFSSIAGWRGVPNGGPARAQVRKRRHSKKDITQLLTSLQVQTPAQAPTSPTS